jgi:hypothetical protein
VSTQLQLTDISSEGSTLNVHRSEGYGILIIFIQGGASSQRWVDKKNAVKRRAIDRTKVANKG